MPDSLTPGEQTVIYVSKFCPEIADTELALQLHDCHTALFSLCVQGTFHNWRQRGEFDLLFDRCTTECNLNVLFMSMQYSLMHSIFNVETYIRKTLYEQCHKKFSNTVAQCSSSFKIKYI